MGLFQHKKARTDGDEEQFIDEYFREELRNHARWHFERIMKENAAIFKQDLDTTITQVNADLRSHVAKQLNDAIGQINTDVKQHVTGILNAQNAEHAKILKDAQDEALKQLTDSTRSLVKQHKQLVEQVAATTSQHETELKSALDDGKTKIDAMKHSQELALRALAASAQDIQEEYQKVRDTLSTSLQAQQQMLITVFEENMAKITEHYVLEALGDQFDIKSQLPSIIKSMSENKEAIIEDMKL